MGSVDTEADMVTPDLIKTCRRKERWVELEKRRWPENIFSSAFIAEGSPLKANADANLLMLEEESSETEINWELIRRLEDRQPELKHSSEDLLAATVSTTYKDGQGDTKTNVRHILRVAVGEDVYDAMVRVRDLLVDMRRGKMVVYPPGADTQGIRMKKLLECVFKDAMMKCLLYRRRTSGTSKIKKPSENSGALVIRREGTSDAEFLRTVKAKVRPNSEAAGAIRTIREARDSSMIIILSEQGIQKKNSLLKVMTELEKVMVKQTQKNWEAAVEIITDIGHDVTEN